VADGAGRVGPRAHEERTAGERSEREQAIVQRVVQAADGDGGQLDEVDDERSEGAHGDLGDQVAVAESHEAEEPGSGEAERADLELGVVGVEVQAAREIHPGRMPSHEEVAAADEVVPVPSLDRGAGQEAKKREPGKQDVAAPQDGFEPHALAIGKAFRPLK
jgi:hypothetical protein